MLVFNKILQLIRRKKTFYLIDDGKKLEIFFQEVSDKNLFGVDTEFDWRQTYFPILSIIQISSVNKIFILDVIKLGNLDRINEFFLNEKNFFIFHSLRSDSTVLSKCLGIKIKNCFDIQIAEKLLNGNKIKGYSDIVKDYIGLRLNKSETNSDWLKRPLSSSQIKYAQEDVDYLLDIYKVQLKLLKKRELLNDVLNLSTKESRLGQEPFKKLRLKRIKKKLSIREREIFLWREEIAEQENIPPSFVFRNKSFKRLCDIKSSDIDLRSKIMKIFGDSYISEKFIEKFL